ncbi:MAG: ABC transporter substrate-binding protein [Gemmatimonadota bacterium]|nr:MAG: ABC transporter substrate-binding protein [Gemmatimonadota bacterium]UCH25442.1 MAG: ABC transporter substrate-binding protein [Trueperaceae bacterium]
MSRIRFTVLASIVFLLLGAASAQQFGGTLVVAAESMGDTLEPGLWTGFGSIHVLDNVGEGLIRSDFVSGEPRPALAESWEISEDGLTYTFKIRQGATFHDGTPVDAAAVVRSFKRFSNEEDPSFISGMYMQFSHGDPNWESLQAIDDATVELVLKAPDSAQLHRLSRPSAYIISPTALDSFGTDIGINYVGAGPFKIENFVLGQEATLVAFEEYWAGRPFLDKIVIRGFPDEASILAALEAGEVDYTTYAPFLSVSRLQRSGTVNVEVGPALVDLFIGASAKNAPTSDVNIRQAVNYAINRDNIIIAGLDGFAEPPASILSPTDLGFDASGRDISRYDPELAREFIAKSGLETPIPIELAFENNRFWPQLAELVKTDLEAVGFDVTLDRLDSGTFWAKAGDGELQLSINQRSTFIPDPDDKALMLHSVRAAPGQTWHALLPNIAEFDRLIDAGLLELDSDKRSAIYAELQALALEQMPYIYLGYLTPPVFVANHVRDVPVAQAAAGRVVLRDVWLDAN